MKIKCWVVFGDEDYPKGLVFEDRHDALEYSKELRENDCEAYTRVKYMTKEQLYAIPEAD